jgi:hypothetical protein
VDARVLEMYRDDGSGGCVRCEMVGGPLYPDDCSTDAERTVREQDRVLVGLSWRDFTIPKGSWSCHSPAGLPGLQFSSPVTCAYGPQWRFANEQADNYERGDPAHRLTEFVEVGFAEAVNPTGMLVGMNRGGGAIVSVKAKNNATGRWQRLYAGAPQKTKYTETNSIGPYFTFNEPLCRAAFLTSVLRIEMDTTAVTGIADWNMIDYVELVGARESQPALLINGSDTVTYVPRADASGEDVFEFQSTDCLGDDLRSADPSPVRINILPRPTRPRCRCPRSRPCSAAASTTRTGSPCRSPCSSATARRWP